ncbi:hypothetical protein [Kerstersia gyiorum]|uniref:hypothetical protein n=1 Tax=Kerstersia gyiorum TaxID=206506 RepID=UPI00187C5D1A|nr:hypothetical protein [Kerstersia gyiorum]
MMKLAVALTVALLASGCGKSEMRKACEAELQVLEDMGQKPSALLVENCKRL